MPFVQIGVGRVVSHGGTVSTPGDVTAGNVVSVLVRYPWGGATLTVTTPGYTWTPRATGESVADSQPYWIFTAVVPEDGPCEVTLNVDGGFQANFVSVIEHSGIDTADPFDAHAKKDTGLTAPVEAGTLTPPDGAELVGVWNFAASSAFSPADGSGLTERYDDVGGGVTAAVMTKTHGSGAVTLAAALSGGGSVEYARGISYALNPAAVETEPALVITQQPTSTQSGVIIDPAVTVRATTDGSTTDEAFDGNVTAEEIGADGVLLGTLVVAAVDGVATFDALRPCEPGTHRIRFTVAGYTPVDSNNYAVTGGDGATLILGGDVPERMIRQNEPSAGLRQIDLEPIYDTAREPWDGDPDAGGGTKAKLMVNNGAETDSPANIVKKAPGEFYVVLAQAYTNVDAGSRIKARVEPVDGVHRGGRGYATIIPGDSYVDLDEQKQALVIAIIRANYGLDGFKFEKVENENKVKITIPGTGDVYADAQFVASVKALLSLGASA